MLVVKAFSKKLVSLNDFFFVKVLVIRHILQLVDSISMSNPIDANISYQT